MSELAKLLMESEERLELIKETSQTEMNKHLKKANEAHTEMINLKKTMKNIDSNFYEAVAEYYHNQGRAMAWHNIYMLIQEGAIKITNVRHYKDDLNEH
jgi:hypothetical protein